MNLKELLLSAEARGVMLRVDGDNLAFSAPKGALTPELREAIIRHKAALLSFLRAGEVAARAPIPHLEAAETKPGPLSAGQARLWFLDRLVPGSVLYNVHFELRMKGTLDARVLLASLSAVVERHAMLRATFPEAEGRPSLVVAPTRAWEMPLVDLRRLGPEDRDAALQRLSAEHAATVFDLARGPLLRTTVIGLEDQDHVLLITQHHIITDGWSVGVFLRDLAAIYGGLCEGAPRALPELPIRYADYARWQETELQGEDARRAEAWWRQALAGLPRLDLPAPRTPARTTHAGDAYSFQLSAELTAGIKDLARRESCTLFVTLLTVWAAVLHRHCQQEDFGIGTAVAGRDRNELRDLVGFFVNTLVMRCDLSGDPDGVTLMRRLRTVVEEALLREEVPFDRIVCAAGADRGRDLNPLFRTILVLENTPFPDLTVPGLSWTMKLHRADGGVRGTAKFELGLTMVETAGGLSATFDYATDLFDAATVERMAQHFRVLAAGLVAEPGRRLSELPLLTAAERHEFVAAWNATTAEFPRERCIHQLFEAQASRTPDAVAVVFEGQELTYRKLNERANQLAHHLRSLGVGPEALVGLCVERSPEMVVGLFGILKAGGAYVPLDPAYPADRLAFMIDDAQACVLLTEARLAERTPAQAARIVRFDADAAKIAAWPATELPPGATPDNLAYVIYTSGSTGKPKGVEIPHRAVVNFLHTMAARPGLSPGDRLLAVTSLSFDIAGLELILPLVVGARVEIATRALGMDGAALRRRLARSGITVMQATPSTWQLLLDAGWEGSRSFKVLVGGEAVPRELCNRLAARAGSVWNMYGPTETTIWSCIHPLNATDGPVLLGQPIANTRVFVLDRHLQPVPVGVPGELFIGGVGLARGYRARPELTSERFIDDPFTPGERLYRTGDLCRYRPDGLLEFLGRIDHQVKIRGYRIELGEIEATLSRHPAVRACVVVAREDAPGDKRLVAYVVLGDKETPLGALRDELKKTLPEHMVPPSFVALEALPLTPNGKVDRKSLPAATAALRDVTRAPATPKNELERTIQKIWQDVLQVEPLGLADNFFDIGGHSLLLARVGALLQKALGREIPVVELFEHPTIAALARHLATAPETAASLISTPRRAPASSSAVAVVGMAGRFPGAEDLDEFWRNLAGGVESVSFFTEEELVAAGVSPRLVKKPTYVKAKAVLKEADWFDASFFGYSPREAALIDPQHRVFLECAWEAIESAGHVPGPASPRIGVFAGASSFNGQRQDERPTADLGDILQSYYGAGVDFLATRTAYKLDLKGPALTLQTACSTSLVAVHIACRSLFDGDCDMALAGGVSITLPLVSGYPYQNGLILSPDGHCRAFDEKAQGTLSGNGVGVVLLKRLEDALADGDTIHAVIRGSAINNDGSAKVGFTAPSVTGQAEVIAQALAAADVGAEQIGYVEAHGTGTPLGDPIEIAALTRVFRQSTSRKGYCALGTVKSNIGHQDAAAGIAGLLKTVLSLKHRQIPPSLHFERPNPDLGLPESPFYVSTQLTDWPSSGQSPRRAGVSSFGIGGTNAHVVLEEAPEMAPAPAAAARSAELFVLSAKSAAALEAQAARLLAHLNAHPELGPGDVAFSLATTRRAMDHRLSVVATSREGLREALTAVGSGTSPPGERRGRLHARSAGKVVFVFPGQGSQWVGMGQKLLVEEPVFRAAIDVCDRAIQREAGWSLLAELAAEEATSQLGRIDVVQPVLFAIEVALAALWRSWGIEPDVVVGHSMGEVAAAYVAGALSLEDAVAIICRRSRLLCRISGQGEMGVVELSLADAAAALSGYEDRLSVAVSNGPRSTVLSGEPDALGQVLSALSAKGVFCHRVKVDVAAHSPQVDPLCADLLVALAGLHPRGTTVPMYSTVTGAMLEGPELGSAYWADNLRQPVRFADAVQAVLEGDHGLFVEMSPHPILLPAIEEIQRAASQKGVVVGSLRRGQDERPAMLESLGALWVRGHAVTWERLFPAGGRRVPLPTYAWQRERHRPDAPPNASTDSASGSRRYSHAGGHPLLGEGQTLSTQAGTRLWETTLDLQRLSWLVDHRIQDTAVFPGTAYLEMALVAGAETFGDHPFQITGVSLAQALAFAGEAAVLVQTVTTEEEPGRLRFKIATLAPGADRTSWRVHCHGALQRAERAEAAATLDLGALRERLGAAVPVTTAYAEMTAMGLDYGPAFQGIVALWRGEGEALGQVRLPAAAGAAAPYRIHPALLDACLQVMSGASLGSGDTTPWVPVEVGSLCVVNRPADELWCHVRSVGDGPPSSSRRSFDFQVVDGTGAAVVDISGLVVQRLPSRVPRREEDGWFLELDWEPAAVPAPRLTAGRWLLLGGGDGLGAALCAVLRASGHAVAHAATHDAGVAGVRRLLAEAFGGQPPTAVVHLGSLEEGSELDADSMEFALVRGYDSVLSTVQALAGMGYRDAPRLWLVTRGAQAVAGGEILASQAPILGLGRTIALEHSELRCARIDLDPTRPEGEVSTLLAELLADDAEDEVALRGAAEGGALAFKGGALAEAKLRESGGGERHVARLIYKLPEAARRERIEPAGDRPFRLEIAKPGVLDDLVLRATERRPPDTGEVEIAVEAAGLNFIDVMMAMGIYPGLEDGSVALGTECAGRIVAVGKGVHGLAAGQEVLTMTPGSSGTHVTVDARKVALRPAGLTAEQAAAIPTVFMTAWYALVHLARLRSGERVLIHSATGGTGLAAVQIARHLGAEIVATAGSPDKRAWLHEQGVVHVMDSRSLVFAEEVLAATGGQGVDVVLNSLSGRAIEASLSALSNDGRFIELGKTDIYADRPLGLAHFKKSLSYSAVDLGGLATRRPERFAALLREVVALFAAGTLVPLPVETFPVSRAAVAYRKMAKAQHIGKLVLTMGDADIRIQLPAQPSAPIRRDGSYLVTGGLGGLGLHVAGWLADKGAGHLVLLGRSGAASAEQQAAVLALEARGARVTVAKVDVAERTQIAPVLDEIAASGMPLRGIAHLAAVLDDGLLAQQTPVRLRQVMAPKALGALHLHELTRALPLDFFVLYASGSGLFGSPGQASYAAANTFLDALAHHRRTTGLPALSVDWGLFAEVGLSAAQDNRGARMVSRGTQSMSLEQGFAALERLLEGGAVHAAVMPFDARQWVEFYPAAAGSPMLSRLVAEESTLAWRAGGQHAARLAAAEPSARAALLSEMIRGEVSRVLRLPEGKLDDNAPLTSLGMDSLMSLELRNRLEAAFGLKVPATLLWTYPTVSALTPLVLAELGGGPAPERDAARTMKDASPDPAAPDPHEGIAGQELIDLLEEEIVRTEKGFTR